MMSLGLKFKGIFEKKLKLKNYAVLSLRCITT
jgi:hypothetical protein